MAKLTIDGKTVEIRDGATVLDAARAAGIFVPALCYHPAVASYGACRLCLVEVKQGSRTRIVTSCCYNVRDGLVVSTTSDKVVKARRGVMELLLARAPESEPLKEMAKLLGVKAGRLPTVTQSQRDCILCGLCVNVCREIIGASAISFVNRGVNRVVAAPFLQPSEACVGCGACAAVCPVGTIKLRWHADEVEISPFKSRIKLLKCSECGAVIGSAPMADRVRKKVGESLAAATLLCDSCKRKRAAATNARLARTSGRS
ncbi:MAG: 2Fe-2S iron-sulfur cluster-binding protein [Candidatus Brocadiia bacterium]